MLATELAVDSLLREYFCDGARGDSIWLEYCDRDGVDAPDARLSIDFRGLTEDISTVRPLDGHGVDRGLAQHDTI